MKPNKLKLMVLVWSAMFPFSTLVSYGLSSLSFMATWPLVVRTFCLTSLLVPYMVLLALPFLNRRFQKWLERPFRSPKNQLVQPEQPTTELGNPDAERSIVSVNRMAV